MSRQFEKEWKEIVRIIAGLHRHHEENDPAIDHQLPKIEKIFENMSKKYPNLLIKVKKDIQEMRVELFVNEESVRKSYDEIASKLKGLMHIGVRGFEEASVQDTDGFTKKIEQIKKELYATYTIEIGTETLVLRYNEEEKKVQMLFELKSLVNPLTPQYQFIFSYALKEVGEDINIVDDCYQLGFTDVEEPAYYDWEDEFYPKMLE